MKRAFIEKISKEQCISGNNYLIRRHDTVWAIAQFILNDYGIEMWYHQNGLTTKPIEIYEIKEEELG